MEVALAKGMESASCTSTKINGLKVVGSCLQPLFIVKK